MQQFKKASCFLWKTKGKKKDIWERGRGFETFASVCQGEERMAIWVHRWELHYQSPAQTPFYLQHPPCDPTPAIELTMGSKFFPPRLTAVWRDCFQNRESGLTTAPKRVCNSNVSFHWAPSVTHTATFHPHDHCYCRQSLLSPSEGGSWASAGPAKFPGHTSRQWQSRKLN